MYGRKLSSEFINMQVRSKIGEKNPQYGKQKSDETIAKLTKLIYVYDYETKNFIGSYPTVKCAKEFQMGKDTLKKYLNNKLPFKNKIFSKLKLH